MQLGRKFWPRIVYSILIGCLLYLIAGMYLSLGIHNYVFYFAGIGLIFGTSPIRIYLFSFLSIVHLLLGSAGYSINEVWKQIDQLIVFVLAVYTIFFTYSELTRSWRMTIRLYIPVVILVGIQLLSLLPFQRFILSVLAWPFLISLLDTRSIFISKNYLYLFNPWHSQFFHNIPTETGPQFFTYKKEKYQEGLRQALHLLAWASLFVIAKKAFDGLLWGAQLFGIANIAGVLPAYTPRVITWNYMQSDSHSIWLKFTMLYIYFLSAFFHFIILGTVLNALAKVWGYNFPLNVEFQKGFLVFRQWKMSFYYLNNVIVNVFYRPIYKELNQIFERKIALFWSITISIFLFGYSYLFLLFNEVPSNSSDILKIIEHRGIYLLVICLVAYYRFFYRPGERRKKSHLMDALVAFLIVAPIIMFGILTLDIRFSLFH